MKVIINTFLLLLAGVALAGCASLGKGGRVEYVTLEATGYCKCGECCGWRRNLLLQPVYAYGPMEGEKKKIGESLEEWTTDSLASHLFEQELTYEDRLNNMLSKKLSK